MIMTRRGINHSASLMVPICYTLEPTLQNVHFSEMSAIMASDGADTGKLSSYPSLGLGNSFSFKFEDLKGRVHRFNFGMW